LKAEVEEWRNISAGKETELRQIKHFLANEFKSSFLELTGKRVDFN
jgi:hypothetical protein